MKNPNKFTAVKVALKPSIGDGLWELRIDIKTTYGTIRQRQILEMDYFDDIFGICMKTAERAIRAQVKESSAPMPGKE